MSEIVAKILIEGDKHFCSKNYGGHKDYPNEVLYYAEVVRDIAKREGITHYINCGDFSFGKFNELEFRRRVDKVLEEMRDITRGRVWFLKGNHDKAASGTTEYEYYLSKGEFRGSECIDVALGTPNGGLHLEMKDYGDYSEMHPVDGAFNILVTHGYFTFDKENTIMKPQLVLAEHAGWSGADFIICGHIHVESLLRGKGYGGKDIAIHYLPCLSRPAYIRDGMPSVSSVDIITVFDDGRVEFEQYPVELLPLEASFDIARITAGDEKKEEDAHIKVDVTDIAKKLEEHVRIMSDPIVAIESSREVPDEVKAVAIELLKEAKSVG